MDRLLIEHTILDFYGTPYGGVRDNAFVPVRSGSNTYTDGGYGDFRAQTYGEGLEALVADPDVTNNKGGIA